MKDLSHQTTVEYLQKKIDGELSPEAREELDRHLSTCGECRDYATLYTSLLEGANQRWGESAPSETETAQMTQNVKDRFSRKQKIRRVFVLTQQNVFSVIALVALVLFAWYLPRLIPQPNQNNPAGVDPPAGMETPVAEQITEDSEVVETQEPELVQDIVLEEMPMVISQKSCQAKPISSPTMDPHLPPRPASLVGGGTVKSGNLVIDFWLYCDANYAPDVWGSDRSEIAGLGIYTAWGTLGATKIREMINWKLLPELKFTPGTSFFYEETQKWSQTTGIRSTHEVVIDPDASNELYLTIQTQQQKYAARMEFTLEGTPGGVQVVDLAVEGVSSDKIFDLISVPEKNVSDTLFFTRAKSMHAKFETLIPSSTDPSRSSGLTIEQAEKISGIKIFDPGELIPQFKFVEAVYDHKTQEIVLHYRSKKYDSPVDLTISQQSLKIDFTRLFIKSTDIGPDLIVHAIPVIGPKAEVKSVSIGMLPGEYTYGGGWVIADDQAVPAGPYDLVIRYGEWASYPNLSMTRNDSLSIFQSAKYTIRFAMECSVMLTSSR
jgi:hypothetical protein